MKKKPVLYIEDAQATSEAVRAQLKIEEAKNSTTNLLLPCPFCGRHAPGPKCGTYMIAVVGGTAVRCPTCNAHGPACPTFDQAIGQWNHRQPNASNDASAVSR